MSPEYEDPLDKLVFTRGDVAEYRSLLRDSLLREKGLRECAWGRHDHVDGVWPCVRCGYPVTKP